MTDDERKKIEDEIYSKFSKETGISVIKVGEGVTEKETITRMRKLINVQRGTVSEALQDKRDFENKFKQSEREKNDLRNASKNARSENERLKRSIQDLKGQIKELEKELKLRRKSDSRFEMMDL